MIKNISLDEILGNIAKTKEKYKPDPPKPKPPPPKPIIVKEPHRKLKRMLRELLDEADRQRRRNKRKVRFEHVNRFVPLVKRRRYEGDRKYYRE